MRNGLEDKNQKGKTKNILKYDKK